MGSFRHKRFKGILAKKRLEKYIKKHKEEIEPYLVGKNDNGKEDYILTWVEN